MPRPGIRLVIVISFLLSVPLSAETLAELFQKAKAQVKSQSWHEALTTLDQLDVKSSGPGNEAIHQQLVAPFPFTGEYARPTSISPSSPRPTSQPTSKRSRARPSTKVYSKKAVAAFEAAGKRGANAQGFPHSRFLTGSRSSRLPRTWARNRTHTGRRDR